MIHFENNELSNVPNVLFANPSLNPPVRAEKRYSILQEKKKKTVLEEAKVSALLTRCLYFPSAKNEHLLLCAHVRSQQSANQSISESAVRGNQHQSLTSRQ